MSGSDRMELTGGFFDPERELAAGSRWLRDYLEEARAPGVVMGISGGLDSATTALWAGRALGAEQLTLVSMPYGLRKEGRFGRSSPESVELALAVAEHVFGADVRVLDIAPTVDAEADAVGLADLLAQHPDREDLRICLANLKARVRATRLRYVANRTGRLLLGTENRSEYLLGYFTLGGDEQSDLELLSPYFKTEVRELARRLDVPGAILFRPASADLWPGQTDAGELGFTYGEADPVLLALERGTDPVAAADGDRELAGAVQDRVETTAFKRTPKPTPERQNPARGRLLRVMAREDSSLMEAEQ